MKVNIYGDMKAIIPMCDSNLVKEICKAFREEDAKDYCNQAISIIKGYKAKIFDIDCEIAKNCRIWNELSDNTKDYDIWFNFKAYCNDSFLIVGVYLTDLWKASEDNREYIKDHMFIREFIER